MSLLVVMGSGETAPTMVKVHRQVLAQSHATSGDGPAVLLDTPFGFQMNADELVDRTQAYFRDSVGHPVEVASWRRADAPVVERERALALIGRASWAFAGPGSPTYALSQWRGTAVPPALAEVVRRGGTLVLGSAAAVTLGSHAVPVYEIYKVGEPPHWADALHLLDDLTGIRAAVVPHYDNAEGASHDTRFCYLGEQRLAVMEAQLPDDVGVLGVDEHTALVLDLAAGEAHVLGNATVTLRRRGSSHVLPAGARIGLAELAARLRGEVLDAGPSAAAIVGAGSDAADDRDVEGAGTAASLRQETDAAGRRFDAALQVRDVEGCVAAVLGLEQALHDWSSDTLQSDDRDVARRTLRGMVSRLGDLAAAGGRDPRAGVAPYVDLLVDLRTKARADKDFATSDLLRDRLAAAGVEVRDTPDGAQWDLVDAP